MALFVFGNFFVHLGLIQAGLVESHSLAHLALMAPLVYLQVKTLQTNERLTRRLLKVGGGADRPLTQGAY